MEERLERKRSERRRKWFFPAACIVATILLILGCCGGLFHIFTGALRYTEPYRGALVRARGSPTVRRALGSPLKAGFLTTGRISLSGKGGDAAFAIPISGPKGRGTLHVVAERSGDTWTFKTLTVELHPSGRKIDLLIEP